jgi:hypothetical protein
MKTKKLTVTILAFVVAAFILSSCHSNIPCPVYAEAETLSEIVTVG